MSDAPNDPSAAGLSNESLSLLESAATPRAMSLAERKVAAQAVAKIAATPVAVVGGFTVAKFTLASAVTVGAAALARTLSQQPEVATPPTRAAIAAPANGQRVEPRPAAAVTTSAPTTPELSAAAPSSATPIERPSAAAMTTPTHSSRPVISNTLSNTARPSTAPPQPSPRAAPTLSSASGGAHSLAGGTLVEPPEQRETTALEQVFTVVSSDPSRAMALLDAFDREFPRSRLRDERDFLGVLVLDRVGRRDEARARAQSLLDRSPTGMYAPRLRRLLQAAPQSP